MDKHRQVICGTTKQAPSRSFADSPPRNNLNSKPAMTAEQRRLNPVAAANHSPERKSMTAEEKRLSPLRSSNLSNSPG